MDADKHSGIPQDHPIIRALNQIADDIRKFIELSLQETRYAWEEWLPYLIAELEVKCWERKGCTKTDCPAYLNAHGRCWLIAGTFCDEKARGVFSSKYRTCCDCEVYQEAIFNDPITEVYEHVITLVHSLRENRERLTLMATRDLLTGLYSRNYFDETIELEIEKVKRYGGKLSIIRTPPYGLPEPGSQNNTRHKQGFVSIDVPHSNDNMIIHDE